jgi:hypothetical protein
MTHLLLAYNLHVNLDQTQLGNPFANIFLHLRTLARSQKQQVGWWGIQKMVGSGLSLFLFFFVFGFQSLCIGKTTTTTKKEKEKFQEQKKNFQKP